MEDDVDQARLLGMLLSKAGHEVEVTFTGNEAWAVMQKRPFDVLLTDMQVPTPLGIKQSDGGLALMIRMRNATGEDVPEWIADMRIIAISGAREYGRGALERAALFGARKCLQKPIRIDDLLDAIRSVLT